MAFITEFEITGNGRQAITMKNHNNGKDDLITYAVDPESVFGGASVALEYGFTNDTSDDSKWSPNIGDGGISITTAELDNISLSSDGQKPIRLGFNVTGATGATNIKIRVYDSKA